jgi:uncharacterized protein (TIGR02391 family)
MRRWTCPQFLLGEYELGALAAMREVEIRVRKLSKAGEGDIGVNLMKSALGVDGPLADPRLERGEREATMALFWGAIGVFKNPSSHRQVRFDDPTLAAEVILLADLLLRMLDRTKARLESADFWKREDERREKISRGVRRAHEKKRSKRKDMPTSLDNGQRSPRKLLGAV